MGSTRKSVTIVAPLLAVCMAACGLWMWHATAWDLGGRSPVLSYDAAQYAVAARELAEHGRLRTWFALPLELPTHPTPPWPLALVQPGLVLAEGAIFRITPPQLTIGGHEFYRGARADQREWLVLILPFCCYLGIASMLVVATRRALKRHAPGVTEIERAFASMAVGLAFVLDPEGQHYAVGGFTELPFTFGLVAALAPIALGVAPEAPFLFGLVLGAAGLFRGNMLWLAPLFAIGAAATAPRGRRARVLGLALLGYALPLAPWWLYKWRMFGTPAWDLSALSVWDGVQGRSWFSLNHLPALPPLPHGVDAARLLGAKVLHNLPSLLLALATGPRAVWLGALVLWALVVRTSRPLVAAAWTAIAIAVVSTLVAALSVPAARYLFPARVLVEAGGLLAAWDLIARVPEVQLGRRARRALVVGLAALAIGWGAWATSRANADASVVSTERGVPDELTMLQISVMLQREVPAGEPVMSNLGPVLSWVARRPVVHLALTPGDIESCRRVLDVRHVLLVFRGPSRAWSGWGEVLAHPQDAVHTPEWNVTRARQWRTPDGFTIVWLELGPLAPALAAAAPGH